MTRKISKLLEMVYFRSFFRCRRNYSDERITKLLVSEAREYDLIFNIKESRTKEQTK